MIVSHNKFRENLHFRITAEIEDLESTFLQLKENYDRALSLESFTVVLNLGEQHVYMISNFMF